MKNTPAPILPYAPPPKSALRLFRLTRRTCIHLTVYSLIALALYAFVHGPTSGQIRLDTGDLRYCWYGIPLRYRPMPEPERSHIVALASRAPAIPHRWVTCVTYPLPSSNNTDSMCRDFYWSVAIWSTVDRQIARRAFDDVVKYIDRTHATSGLPDSCEILDTFVVDWHSCTVNPAWRDMEEVKSYCTCIGYTPPPAAAPTAPLTPPQTPAPIPAASPATAKTATSAPTASPDPAPTHAPSAPTH